MTLPGFSHEIITFYDNPSFPWGHMHHIFSPSHHLPWTATADF